MKKIIFVVLISFVVAVFASGYFDAPKFENETVDFELVKIADGLEHPWSMAFMPNGKILLSERAGRLRVLSKQGEISPPVEGLPDIYSNAQGGLLGVAIDPEFESNNTIYFSFSESIDGKSGTAVAKGVLEDNSLKDLQIIFRQEPKTSGSNHFGSRLVFSRDGKLFVTLGEKFNFSKEAQNLDNHLGKLVRINPDGTAPNNNPFVDDKKAKPEIWSYGHRNIQGAAINPSTGDLWIHEHGPRGGDEINIPEAGKNYGWPNASYGSHYTMIPIEDNHSSQGYEEPIHYWTPSIAPSGMMFYTGDVFEQWKGSLFVGSLAKTHLARLEISGDKILKEYRLLNDLEYRVRDVAQDKDGYIYVITDSDDGRIFKLMPK